jgi:hypothetical protein
LLLADAVIEKRLSNIGEYFMTNKNVPLLIAVAFCCLAGWSEYAQAQRSNPTRQTWEYTVIDAQNGPNRIQTVLNQYGAQGWEYTGRSGDYYLFKRPR